MKAIVIIPALNPDEKLIKLVEDLQQYDLQTIIVDDGSGREYAGIFDTVKSCYQCDVCVHPVNMGKGAALKTGIRFAVTRYPDGIGYITADADGQHSAEDIFKIAKALHHHPDRFILGTRNFKKGNVPFKSRWGNRITSLAFWLSTGRRCADTQTGLRGIPKRYAGMCLSVAGNRYEYEMNLLLEMARQHIPFLYEPIATIYLDENQSSHFHPFRDSFLIYMNICKYSLSSLVSAAADLTLFTLLARLVFGTGAAGLLAATVLARLCSGGLNFTFNKFWVFRSRQQTGGEAVKYFSLFGCQMLASWLLVALLSRLPLHLTLVKTLADVCLFFLSYLVQKKYIFYAQPKKKGRPLKMFFKTT